MDNNTERYLEAFNKLENALKVKLGKDRFTPFARLIKEGAKADKFILDYLNVLESLSDLRNVLVHKEGNKIIATPSDYAIEMLENIYERYTKPTTVEFICNRDVITLRTDTSLYKGLEIMKKHSYSKLPVYSKEKFEGMFTGTVFTKWYIKKLDSGANIRKELDETYVTDIVEKGDVKFIRRDMDVYEFVSVLNKKTTKSGIYIVTEHGKNTEKPIGIITSFDYKQILESISFNI